MGHRVGHLIATAAGAAVLFAAPAAASAATFYVDDSSPTTPVPCTSPPPADACQTIFNAVAQARMVAGPNTIEVADGTYTDTSINLGNTADDGLTIEGDGNGGALVVMPDAGSSVFSMNRPGITLRDLTAKIPGTATAAAKTAISIFGTATSLDHVDVLMTGGDSNDAAISTSANAGSVRTLDDVNVSDDGNSAWTGDAFSDSGSGTLTITDSQFQVNGLGSAIVSSADSALVQRTAAESTGPATAGPIVIDVVSPGATGHNDPVLTLDSSLVIGGSEGVAAHNAFVDASHQSATVHVRDSTIDPGLPKGNDGIAGLYAFGNVGNATATLTADSSIIVGAAQATGNVANTGASSITCTHSDVPNQSFAGDSTHGPVDCGTAAGNPGGNSTTAPGDLFVFNIFGLNWHLKDGSPAIDTGSSAALAGGESATDLDGNARVLNGEGACPPIRDKGAYEHAAGGVDCSPPAPIPPAVGATPAATTPATAGAKCKKKRKKAVGAKKCRRKKRR